MDGALIIEMVRPYAVEIVALLIGGFMWFSVKREAKRYIAIPDQLVELQKTLWLIQLHLLAEHNKEVECRADVDRRLKALERGNSGSPITVVEGIANA